MKITFHSHLKQMGFWPCVKSGFGIRKYWGGKIINVGGSLFYASLDFRKDVFKEMIKEIK